MKKLYRKVTDAYSPKVSIVIPVYNGSNYLHQAIDSALSQTYANVEVIVVNDGSNDNGKTEAIAKSYRDKIRYFSKENGGVASALNYGIKEMKGDYFSWLSHDDLYYPEKIEEQIDCLRSFEGNDVIVYSDYDLIDEYSELIHEVPIPHYEPNQFVYELLKCSFLHGCTLLVPKICFDTIGVFDETLATTQDYQLWVRMSKIYDFVHLPKRLVKARCHNDQGSKRLYHVKEIDQFYVWALSQLEASSIQSMYGQRASKYFGLLAVVYKERGLVNAYRSALEKQIEEEVNEGGFPLLKAKIKAILYRLQSEKHRMDNKLSSETKLKRLFRSEKVADIQSQFTKIYRKNLFCGSESRSGVGSNLDQTKVVREELPKLVRKLGVKTFVDAPCGDFYWMKETILKVDRYIGIDLVEEIVKKNKEKYQRRGRTFICRNIIEDDIPKADMILCRDCLVHLTFDQGIELVKNFKRSGSTFLLATTFTERCINFNSIDEGNVGKWRPLNMQLPPFNFPNPICIINEKCSEGEGEFKDKSLGLWRLKDILL
jgi:glycosyltransferase involved in cell wall biosynthesis